MQDTLRDADRWLDTVRDHAPVLIAAASILGLILLTILAVIVAIKKKPIMPTLATIGVNLTLAVNAQGTWGLFREQLGLAADITLLVFAAFEIALVTMQFKARATYFATSEWEIVDGQRKIKEPGHPGPYLRVAWGIAVGSGLLVATNAKSWQEAIVRVALPAMVQLLWQVINLSSGWARRPGKFVWSWERLAAATGLWAADANTTIDDFQRDRRRRAMVRHGYKIETSAWLRGWHRHRLNTLGLKADLALADEVAAQIEIAVGIANLVSPIHRKAAAEQAERERQAAEAAAELQEEQARQRQQAIADEERRHQQLLERQQAEDLRRQQERQLAFEQETNERLAQRERHERELQLIAARAEAERVAEARAAAEADRLRAQAAADAAQAERVLADVTAQVAADPSRDARPTRPDRPVPSNPSNPSRDGLDGTDTQDAQVGRDGTGRGDTARRANLVKIHEVAKHMCGSWAELRQWRSGDLPLQLDGKTVSFNAFCDRVGVRRPTVRTLIETPGLAEQLLPWPQPVPSHPDQSPADEPAVA